MSLNLVLSYESSALAAPQSFRHGMQAAANILDSLIANNITVTIQVRYGDWDNNADTGLTTSAEGGDLNGLYVSYTSLRAALASHETSALDQKFVNSLPNASSVNGISYFYVPSAVSAPLIFFGTSAHCNTCSRTRSSSLLIGTSVMRSQQCKQMAFGLIGNHLDDVGQVLPFRGEPDDGPLVEVPDFDRRGKVLALRA